MSNILEAKEKTFSDFLTSVDEDLGRDEESLHLFEWVIEDRYESRIKNNKEFFKDRPDKIAISNEQIILELNKLHEYFLAIEEYEKCISLDKIKTEILEKI